MVAFTVGALDPLPKLEAIAAGGGGLAAPGNAFAAGRETLRLVPPVVDALGVFLALGFLGGIGRDTLLAGSPELTVTVPDL